MAGRQAPSFMKRQKEQQRAARAQAKRQAKQERKEQRAANAEAGIVEEEEFELLTGPPPSLADEPNP